MARMSILCLPGTAWNKTNPHTPVKAADTEGCQSIHARDSPGRQKNTRATLLSCTDEVLVCA
jgi:hypothetical protein